HALTIARFIRLRHFAQYQSGGHCIAACPIFALAASRAPAKFPRVMIWRVLFLLALAGLASCGKKPGEPASPTAQGPLPEPPMVANCEPGQRGGRLVIATFGEPKTFNPLTANESS